MNEIALGDVTTIIGGGTPARSDASYFDGDIPWVSVKDMADDQVVLRRTQEHISQRGLNSSASNLIPAGNILLATRIAIGRTCINAVDVAINQDLKALICSNRVVPKYLLYYLLSQRHYLEDHGEGATVKGITLDLVKGLMLPLPPLPEQQRLAALLDKADHLRRTRRYAQHLSDTFLQSVFLEMFGDYLASPTAPQFHEVLEKPLSNGLFENNINYGGSGVPVIWVDNLYHTTSIDMSQLRRARLSAEATKKYAVAEGDLLFTRSSLVREGIGQVNIVPELPEPTTYECHTIRARVNRKVINPYYALGLYRSSFGRRLIMGRANTATMTTIGQDGIGELLCPLPPMTLQEQFAQVVRRTERLRGQQREAARQAEHLFQTLLFRAFRG